MNDRMQPVPFARLLDWALTEKEHQGTVFGVRKSFQGRLESRIPFLDGFLENVCGPAAGPHTQLAQNIVAAYAAGARFFELKTVQTLDGEELHVDKPCIRALDEGYNVEWSTELTTRQAMEEYIKAWFLLQVLSREWQLGQPDGFIFNMSVGYDLKGIQSAKIDAFIEGLKDARATEIWQECLAVLQDNLLRFQRVTAADLEQIPARICSSITLSTMHGCKPQEIERIAAYLITKKGLHTFVKCNPTLLGYDFARRTLDALGYDYLVFDERHFREDLHFSEAIPMLKHLQKLAAEQGLTFGVKLTNTFPVEIVQEELPGEEMYMSGRALFPLTITVADRIAQATAGQLPISYSGGADAHNIAALARLGIAPVTLATTLLKPGGYDRITQLARRLAEGGPKECGGIDVPALHRFARGVLKEDYYRKDVEPLLVKKQQRVPLFDCFTAPCRMGCPIHQDIPAYLRLTAEGNNLEALRLITRRNPLPFLTGTTCYHGCMKQCMRRFYDQPVNIRGAKLAAVHKAFSELLSEQKPAPLNSGKCAAVIGGGPAGLAAGYFLARAGWQTIVFEKTAAFGGMIGKVVPELRADSEAMQKDLAWIRSSGVQLVRNVEKIGVQELLCQGYDAVVLAIGAWKPKRRTDAEFYQKNGLQVTKDGWPVIDEKTQQTSRPQVYAIGDGAHRPAGVAEAIADAIRCVEALTGKPIGGWPEGGPAGSRAELLERHGVLLPQPEGKEAEKKSPGMEGNMAEHLTEESAKAGQACLGCSTVCETCVEVCPNRANLSVTVPGLAMAQILHLDGLCNACGNCVSFCPYGGAPYRDKFTLFQKAETFAESTQDGFYCEDKAEGRFRVRLDGRKYSFSVEQEADNRLPEKAAALIRAVWQDYSYVF